MSSYFDASGNLSKFVLQRLIGRFLQEDLDLDQLKVRLFRGGFRLICLTLVCAFYSMEIFYFVVYETILGPSGALRIAWYSPSDASLKESWNCSS